ncbi:hypothetical protein Tco_1089369 [Tanacetum coccineum]
MKHSAKSNSLSWLKKFQTLTASACGSTVFLAIFPVFWPTSESGPPRLLLLVVGGIVGGIVVGNYQVVVEKFKYIAFVVEVAIVEMSSLSKAGSLKRGLVDIKRYMRSKCSTDRFLISESLMNSCPNISAITLERFLSDHLPILMRESHYDYGHVPFRFFHYLFEIKGFDKFVEDSWKEAVVVELNAMTKLMKKLKHLKEKIRL